MQRFGPLDPFGPWAHPGTGAHAPYRYRLPVPVPVLVPVYQVLQTGVLFKTFFPQGQPPESGFLFLVPGPHEDGSIVSSASSGSCMKFKG